LSIGTDPGSAKGDAVDLEAAAFSVCSITPSAPASAGVTDGQRSSARARLDGIGGWHGHGPALEQRSCSNNELKRDAIFTITL